MQIAWHYIVTYSLPFIAKTLSGVSANATLINTFSSSSQTLSNYTTTTIAGGVTPNVSISQAPSATTLGVKPKQLMIYLGFTHGTAFENLA